MVLKIWCISIAVVGCTVVMTDVDGKQLVIDCDKAEGQVVFDEQED